MMGLAIVVVATLLVAAECGTGRAALIKVGGSEGWVPTTNYTEWVSNQHFYVGDWLYFIFNKEQFDVLEVNETVYELCNSEAGFIFNVTRGGRDVFQLTEARTYYFLCSRGYCWGGMKVAIHVEQLPPPAPSPAKRNTAASAGPCRAILVLTLTLALSVIAAAAV